MSTIKHQPATPLPWMLNGENWYAIDKYGMNVNVGSADAHWDPTSAAPNAAYAVHAANAYPRLVAAIQEHFAATEQPNTLRQANARSDMRVLLRELEQGEQ